MKKHIAFIVIITGMISFYACKEKYLPPAIDQGVNYLVVDGSLINGPDSTIIRLSRTKKLEEGPDREGEQNAQMSVEDAAGNIVYHFIQLNNKGEYAVPGMSLDVNKKYRLRINTTNGNQYISDDIVVKDTPPIDSISWQKKDEGVTVYVNTHDPANATKYYRWEYMETWVYYSNYYSSIKYDENGASTVDKFPSRTSNEIVYQCWTTQYSTEIFPGTSAKLSEDRINLYPLRFIPQNAIELSSMYSILVKQYALTKEAYEYFENIKKISEQTGTLFDAQPSQLQSNIHCINQPDEQVIGFLSASTLRKQRIFIRNIEVQPWRYSYYCEPVYKVPLDSLDYYYGGNPSLFIPIELVYDPRLSGVNGAPSVCVDCTLRGGTTIKPAFWP